MAPKGGLGSEAVTVREQSQVSGPGPQQDSHAQKAWCFSAQDVLISLVHLGTTASLLEKTLAQA